MDQEEKAGLRRYHAKSEAKKQLRERETGRRREGVKLAAMRV